MPRNFPRFLFSDPQNTKSEGPFVVHLLNPKKLYRIKLLGHDYELHEIPGWGDDCTEAKSSQIYRDAISWVNGQLKSHEIKLGKWVVK